VALPHASWRSLAGSPRRAGPHGGPGTRKVAGSWGAVEGWQGERRGLESKEQPTMTGATLEGLYGLRRVARGKGLLDEHSPISP